MSPRSTARLKSRFVAAMTRMSARMRSRAAEPLQLARFDHAQQLGLCGGAHLANLVEQQRAAGGELDLSRLGSASRR